MNRKGTFQKGHIPWSKGLTKKTDERVANISKKLSRLRIPRETRTCLCGCGTSFTCKENSKQRFIHGHGKRQKIPLETRVCKCGCEGTFTCKENSKQRFIHGHHNKCQSQETIDKRIEANKGKHYKVPLETRYCECKCGEAFICKENSKQRFIKGHQSSCQSQEVKDKKRATLIETWKDPELRKKQSELKKGHETTQETREKIGDAHRSLWDDPRYKDKQIQAMWEGRTGPPNECEKLLFKIVDSLFPGKYLLNTKGEHVRPAGKMPDIVNIKDRKVIEHQGDYWHANSEFCKRTRLKFVDGVPIATIRRRDKKRIDLIEKQGWRVLVVWGHELRNEKQLKKKVTEFQKECV